MMGRHKLFKGVKGKDDYLNSPLIFPQEAQ